MFPLQVPVDRDGREVGGVHLFQLSEGCCSATGSERGGPFWFLLRGYHGDGGVGPSGRGPEGGGAGEEFCKVKK